MKKSKTPLAIPTTSFNDLLQETEGEAKLLHAMRHLASPRFDIDSAMAGQILLQRVFELRDDD